MKLRNIDAVSMFSRLYKSVFIFLVLILSSVPGVSAEIINLGGLRKVSAELTQNKDDWTVKVNMIPVKCFTPLTNRKVTRNYAKRYAMTALAVHCREKVLSAKSCFILSEKHSENLSSVVFQISGVSSGKIQNSVSDTAKNTESLSDDLLNRKNDWINVLTCFFNELNAEVYSLCRNVKTETEDFLLKIAELEEDCAKNCKTFTAKIHKDPQLLTTEKEELLSVLQKKQKVMNVLLRKASNIDFKFIADSFSEIKLQDAYRIYLMSDKILMDNGGAELYELSASQYLLVSVGCTDVRADTVEDNIRREKAAKINALVHLLKMTGVKITVKSVSKDDNSVIKNSDGTAKTISLEELFETTIEQAQGKVRALPVIGTWYSKDKTIFYTATGEFIHHE